MGQQPSKSTRRFWGRRKKTGNVYLLSGDGIEPGAVRSPTRRIDRSWLAIPGKPTSRQPGRHGQRRHLSAEPRIGTEGPDHSRGRESPCACEAGSRQIGLPVAKCLMRSVQESAAQTAIRGPSASRCRGLCVILLPEDGVQKSSGFLQVVSPRLEAVGLAGRVPADQDGGFVKFPRHGILARKPVPEFPVDHIAIGGIEAADVSMCGTVRDDRRATERILLPEQPGKIAGWKAQELQSAGITPDTTLPPGSTTESGTGLECSSITLTGPASNPIWVAACSASSSPLMTDARCPGSMTSSWWKMLTQGVWLRAMHWFQLPARPRRCSLTTRPRTFARQGANQRARFRRPNDRRRPGGRTAGIPGSEWSVASRRDGPSRCTWEWRP